MKKTYILIAVFIYLFCGELYSQTLVGIYNSSITISPSYAVNEGTSYSVTGEVINTGTIAITGNVYVNLAIDTSSTTIPNYYWRTTIGYPVTNFLPGTVFQFTVSDVASNQNSYKLYGNGTTVVVWPVAVFPNDSLTCTDSATAVIYVTSLSDAITELSKIESLLEKIPNPVYNDIKFDNTEKWEIELVDQVGKKELVHDGKLVINNYANGVYYLRCITQEGTYFSRKILINK